MKQHYLPVAGPDPTCQYSGGLLKALPQTFLPRAFLLFLGPTPFPNCRLRVCGGAAATADSASNTY